MKMTQKEVAAMGGKVMAKRQRETALSSYYGDPNRCLQCGEIIQVTGVMKVSVVRQKKIL